MSKRQKPYRPPHLTVDYTVMGIMTLDELKQALWTDLQVLKETYNVKYIKGPMLKLNLTDQFGEVAPLKSLNDGKPIYRMHTRHFRPACQDYEP